MSPANVEKLKEMWRDVLGKQNDLKKTTKEEKKVTQEKKKEIVRLETQINDKKNVSNR